MQQQPSLTQALLSLHPHSGAILGADFTMGQLRASPEAMLRLLQEVEADRRATPLSFHPCIS